MYRKKSITRGKAVITHLIKRGSDQLIGKFPPFYNKVFNNHNLLSNYAHTHIHLTAVYKLMMGHMVAVTCSILGVFF